MLHSYLQLSTKALASSKRESGKSAVRQSVMLKKCFSRPMNVDWSHRGASMSNDFKAIVVKKQSQPNKFKSYPSHGQVKQQVELKPRK